MTIDFASMRGDTIEGKRSHFEQLACRLAERDEGLGIFRRIFGAGGDGGVEAVRVLPCGNEVGYQAKYFIDDVKWSQLDDSVNAALNQHPKLERYVFVIPCDLTGARKARGGSTEGEWGKWDAAVKKWGQWAKAASMQVTFELWTAFDLEGRLLRSGNEDLLKFFFDSTRVLTRYWFEKMQKRTLKDLGSRYSPNEHVDTEALRAFDVLLRSPRAKNELASVFDEALMVRLQDAINLVPDAGSLDIRHVEDALSRYKGLKDAINQPFQEPWPVLKWNQSWDEMMKSLRHLNDELESMRPGQKGERQAIHDLLHVYKMGSKEIFAGRWNHLLALDFLRAALFVGEAGSGKSHVLARGSELALKGGYPVVHILGQHLPNGNPRASICQHLELDGWAFTDLLSALDLAAEAAGTRALFIVDAINEGDGLQLWKDHISSFVSEVVSYPRIALIISCRDQYLPYVVDKELIADPYLFRPDMNVVDDGELMGKLSHVRVEGFRTYEERRDALHIYCDAFNIVRPSVPLLDPEFYNPLFLSSICRSMAKAGMTSFPRGIRGASAIFEFVLEAKSRSLGTPYDRSSDAVKTLKAALDAIAGQMLADGTDYVPLATARDLIDRAFDGYPLRQLSWLTVLEGSDLVRRDVLASDHPDPQFSGPDEVIRFAFQRLEDHIIAIRLFRQVQKVNLEDAFKADGPWTFLLRRYRDRHDDLITEPARRWAGTLGALWAIVAEKYGCELWDLKGFWEDHQRLYPRNFQFTFKNAVLNREPAAFTDRTLNIFDFLWEEESDDKLSLLLSLSCVADHAWNMDYLEHRILELDLAVRTRLWDGAFSEEYSEAYRRADEIIDFCCKAGLSSLEPSVAKLAGKCLAWLSLVSHATLHDKVILGMTRLLDAHSETREELAIHFAKLGGEGHEIAMSLKSLVEKTAQS